MELSMEMLKRYIGVLSGDERIKPKHISIFLVLIYIQLLQNSEDRIRITRRMIMEIAHIGSAPTYHKYITDLRNFGYIDYLPSYHPAQGSRVRILI